MPGKRYYDENEFIDDIENLCCSHAFLAYHLDLSSWGINIQPYSGFPCQLCLHLRELNRPPRAHLSHCRHHRPPFRDSFQIWLRPQRHCFQHPSHGQPTLGLNFNSLSTLPFALGQPIIAAFGGVVRTFCLLRSLVLL
ncbi:hypothetical protein MLD38_031221 [Melastoma candidum]|uniref:Uncharacterized protein n=1 Tax=Melastoma candidum TaxID=119954 RepID=A0ACB9MNF6_9MYRT|nr:hypothetical protein MLD38_031221 [Melastoma candidum]